MAKDKISDYSATANSNTDIGGINIDEGCAPSGINDAIRTLMKQIKDLYAGTSGDKWPVASGGTGATSASDARTNLGLAIGTDVQAYDADLAAIASSGKGAEIASYGTNGIGFRNRIINGGMVIDQRNAGASVTITNTAATTYILDRQYAYTSQASKFSVQQNAGSVTPPTGFSNYLGVTSLSAYSVTSNDIFEIGHKVEGFNFADLAWGTAFAATVTLSFWVRSSLTGTFGGAFRNSAGNRAYPFTYTISSANTWEQKTITVAGDTTGTWVGATNGTGLDITFGLGVGSTYSSTAGAWGATIAVSATGATSIVGTNGATFYITGVQLEKGSTATSFDYRPYGTELALCQRYYFQHSGSWNSVSFYYYPVMGRLGSSTTAAVVLQFPTTMRSAPTFTQTGGTNTWINSGAGNVKGVTLTTDVASSQSINLNATFSAISGGAAGQGIVMYQDGVSATSLAFSAEL